MTASLFSFFLTVLDVLVLLVFFFATTCKPIRPSTCATPESALQQQYGATTPFSPLLEILTADLVRLGRPLSFPSRSLMLLYVLNIYMYTIRRSRIKDH